MNWWEESMLIDGKRQTANEYLQSVYPDSTNAHIASVLSKVSGNDVSSNAVRKRARRLGLSKLQNVTESITKQDCSKNLGNGVNLIEDGNFMTVTSDSKLINTVEDLLRYCLINLDEWQITKQKVVSWQIGAKTESKDLTYVDGVMSGTVKSDGIEKEQLVKIELTLERKRRIATMPDILPIKCDASLREASRGNTKQSSVNRAIVWSDAHFGYKWQGHKLLPLHNRNVLSLLDQILTNNKFDAIYCLGDLFDFAAYSTHFVQSPEFSKTTQPALFEAHWILQRQRKLQPDACMVILQGNHDKRPEETIKQYLEESYQLRGVKDFELPYSTYSIANLIDLQGLGIEWIEGYPSEESWLANIRLSHGNIIGSNPGDTVKKLMQKSEDSEGQGHGHRMECSITTKNFNRRAKTQLAFMTGCACHTDGRVPGHNPHTQHWQNGFNVIEHDDNSVFNITFIPVVDNKCVYNGELYTAQDYLHLLRKDLPMWNW